MELGGGFAVLVVFGINAGEFEADAGVTGFGSGGTFEPCGSQAVVTPGACLQAGSQVEQRRFVLRQHSIAGSKLFDLVPLLLVNGVIQGAFQLFGAIAHGIDSAVDIDVAAVVFHIGTLPAEPAAFAVLPGLAVALVEQAAAFVGGIVGAGGGRQQQAQGEKERFVHGRGFRHFVSGSLFRKRLPENGLNIGLIDCLFD